MARQVKGSIAAIANEELIIVLVLAAKHAQLAISAIPLESRNKLFFERRLAAVRVVTPLALRADKHVFSVVRRLAVFRLAEHDVFALVLV